MAGDEVRRFGQTDAEREAADSLKCRQIVREVCDFGVSQKQILKIVKLLALEVEDRTTMLKIIEAVDGKVPGSQIETPKKSIIK